MPAFAITGIIGSGKSHTLDSLALILSAEVFSADETNRQLLDDDPEVKKLIISCLGNACYREDGKVDRKNISDQIRFNQGKRGQLENILHPRLRKIWEPQAEKYRRIKNSFFIAEIPLLYEKHLEHFFDKIILVASSHSTRRNRLQEHRFLTSSEIDSWSNMQDSQNSKISKANHIIWNDGSLAMLHNQIQLLASLLLQS